MANSILDAAWLGGGLYTVRNVAGTAQFQLWAGPQYDLQLVAQHRGTANALLTLSGNRLLAITIDAPTKIEFLDQAALRAVRSSGPFPALPAKYLNSSLEVYLVFKYGD